jgi:hypothetical protein
MDGEPLRNSEVRNLPMHRRTMRDRRIETECRGRVVVVLGVSKYLKKQYIFHRRCAWSRFAALQRKREWDKHLIESIARFSR